MRYKGKIRELNHIIISDPSYDESVTCRYEKDNLREKDWYVDIDIKPTIDKIEDFTFRGTEFFLFLYKDKKLCELKENGTISYLKGIKLNEIEIGMDTACVALGIDKKAKKEKTKVVKETKKMKNKIKNKTKEKIGSDNYNKIGQKKDQLKEEVKESAEKGKQKVKNWYSNLKRKYQ